jgi:hypothetical protein
LCESKVGDLGDANYVSQAAWRFRLVAVAEASTTASSPATAIPAATPASESSSAASASEPALADLGPGFVYVESAGSELASVDRIDGLLGFLIVGHFYKAETSRLACITVFEYRNVIDLPVSCKSLSKFVFTDVEIQIAYINILHAILLR